MDKEELEKQLGNIPDEVLSSIAFSMPWQYDPDTGTKRDPDGFDSPFARDKEDDSVVREVLQKTSWMKFHENPQVNTSIRGLVGRLTGEGFETASGIFQIQEQIKITEKDHRNRLYHFWPKYVGRFNIEGELFICLTVHMDGFVEVDFIDPSTVGEIIFHSRKTIMPLFYNVEINGSTEQIPSIFIARYPELLSDAKKSITPLFSISDQQPSRSRKHAYNSLKGYHRFIVSTDKGFITHRATSYLRTILRWLNHYEDLKKYEIDHKKSSGAYTWVFSFDSVSDFRVWLALSDDDRRKTGVLQKMEPGCRLFLPPGMKLEAKNPNLTSIREQDTDILQMVTSGLNEASDVTTGTPAGSYSSVRATRGPMSDRVSDEVAYFDRFLKYDFWSSIFFLKSAVGGFPEYFEVEEAIDFKSTEKKNEEGETEYDVEPIFKSVKRKPEDLIDISYPVSETIDFEGRAKAFLGAKHGPMSETLGLPSEDIAKKIGAGNYKRLRLRKATEDKRYPKLVYTVDAESLQETAEGEPRKGKSKEKKKEVKTSSLATMLTTEEIFCLSEMSKKEWKKAYKEGSAHWAEDLQSSEIAQNFIEQISDKKILGKTILEVGCGNGRDSILFAYAGLKATAIDFIPDVIKIAKKNAKKAGVDVDFREGDAERLVFSDNSFDFVFSLSVLHATDLSKSVPEVRRVLKKKGLCLIYIYSDIQKISGDYELIISVDDFIKEIQLNDFKIEDIYTTIKDEYDEVGEKHLVIVAKLRGI